jgi:hypothetical protein
MIGLIYVVKVIIIIIIIIIISSSSSSISTYLHSEPFLSITFSM